MNARHERIQGIDLVSGIGAYPVGRVKEKNSEARSILIGKLQVRPERNEGFYEEADRLRQSRFKGSGPRFQLYVLPANFSSLILTDIWSRPRQGLMGRRLQIQIAAFLEELGALKGKLPDRQMGSTMGRRYSWYVHMRFQ